MTLGVIVVGRARPPLDDAVAEFEARAARYWKISIVEVDAGLGRGGKQDPSQVADAEGARILARLPDDTDLWALTRAGKGMGSAALARELGRRMLHPGRGLAVCIGGAYGLSPAVLARAERRVSLSPMTLPHELARLVWAEQLYRAGTILRGEPYHKGTLR